MNSQDNNNPQLSSFYHKHRGIRTPRITYNDLEGKPDLSAYIKADGTVPFTADQSMGSNNLTNVADPVNAQDAATKNYVDTSIPAATPPTISLAPLRNNTTDDSLYIRQVYYDSSTGDLYWLIRATADYGHSTFLCWATKPTGFTQHFTAKVFADTLNSSNYGILPIGDYVYVNDRDSLNGLSRYDAKTFANRVDWGWNGTVTDGQMAYDGSTYVYIVDAAATSHARRYTIDSTNSDFVYDSSWVTGSNDYKLLPVGLDLGFWCDGTYLYGFSGTDKKLYQVEISSLTVTDSIAVDTNFEYSSGNGSVCGVVKVGTQWYMFYDILGYNGTNYYPSTLIGIPFSW